MKIILDTDKKTITVPYNYKQKHAELNRIAREFGGPDVPEQSYTGYLDRVWRECMSDADKRVVVGKKPLRNKKG